MIKNDKQTIFSDKGKREKVTKYINGKKIFRISFYENGKVASKAIYRDSVCLLYKTYKPCGQPLLTY